MIKTEIILKVEENIPVCHKSTGLAKDLSTARWMFEVLGWKGCDEYPGLSYEVERVYWHGGENIFPSDKKVLWLLGHHVILN